MRQFVLVNLLLFASATLAFAGVPEAVTKAFNEKFPKAGKVKWSEEKQDYEAEFLLNGVQMSAHFNETGRWTETETSIAIGELPKPVLDYVTQNHPKAKINEAAKIARPGMDVFFYEAEIKENGKETDLVLTANGVLVK